MKMFKAVIFDWDGTLADTKKAVVKSFKKVLEEVGCSVVDEFIERRIGFLKQLGVIEYTEKAKALFPEDVK